MPYTSQYSLEKDCSVKDQPDCADAKPTVPFTGLTCIKHTGIHTQGREFCDEEYETAMSSVQVEFRQTRATSLIRPL